MNSDVDRDRRLFARVAETNPGLVRTLGVLIGELQASELPPPDVLRAYGEHVRRLGDTIVARADALEYPPPTVINELT